MTDQLPLRPVFTSEGVTRGSGWRDGVTYSLLRTDPGS